MFKEPWLIVAKGLGLHRESEDLGWEDPLEEEMATHSCILAEKIPWTEEPWQANVHGVAKSRT